MRPQQRRRDSSSVSNTHSSSTNTTATSGSSGSSSSSSSSVLFVRATLRQLAERKEGRKWPRLSSACQATLDRIQWAVNEADPSALQQIKAEEYFNPMRVACETKHPKLIEIAVDCLQKMISYGIFASPAPPMSVPPIPPAELHAQRKLSFGTLSLAATPVGFADSLGMKFGDAIFLVDQVVHTICNCYTPNTSQPAIELQIVKALLAAVTSPNCELHGQFLLLAVRTCYSVCLRSKGEQIRQMARASLFQMVIAVFQRIENSENLVPNMLAEDLSAYAHYAQLLNSSENEEIASSGTATSAESIATTSIAGSVAGGGGGGGGGGVSISKEMLSAFNAEMDLQHQQRRESKRQQHNESGSLHGSLTASSSMATINAPAVLSMSTAQDAVGRPDAESMPASDAPGERHSPAENGNSNATAVEPAVLLLQPGDSNLANGAATLTASEAVNKPDVTVGSTEEEEEEGDKGGAEEPVAILPDVSVDESLGRLPERQRSSSIDGRIVAHHRDAEENLSAEGGNGNGNGTSSDAMAEEKGTMSDQPREDEKDQQRHDDGEERGPPARADDEDAEEDVSISEENAGDRELKDASEATLESVALSVGRDAANEAVGADVPVVAGGGEGDGGRNGDNFTDDNNSSTNRDASSRHLSAAELQSLLEIRLQKDAYLVFRSLCRVSMNSLPVDIAVASSQDLYNLLRSEEVRSKVLSLELLVDILQKCGPSLRKSEMMINALKKHLVVSICSNAMYDIKAVFDNAIKIFQILLLNFLAALKYEMGICFKEIILKVTSSPTASYLRRLIVLDQLLRICSQPQLLLDLYLNYDCDPEALESNLFERIVTDVARIAQHRVNAQSEPAKNESEKFRSDEFTLKLKSMEVLAAAMHSLVSWTRRFETPAESIETPTTARDEKEDDDISFTPRQAENDDPEHFEHLKQQKMVLQNRIAIFNSKPKKGVKLLIESGHIKSDSARDIASFLLQTEGLNKQTIGELLGEPEQEWIDTMHAFVDLLNFENLEFIDALRIFLQKFRLPGEAQKIDRFMLKFANRYVENNPGKFANADAAYVLAYSVIMLNTDQHNPQVRRRMTKAEFVRNNSGINDGSDLPLELLERIFDDISANEIKMKDTEQMTDKDKIKDSKERRAAFLLESEEILKRSQALFNDGRERTNVAFYRATRVEHVKLMFEICWMPLLGTFSGFFHETEDKAQIQMALQVFADAVRVASIFYLEMPRDAFLTGLTKFTLLSSGKDEMRLSSLKEKHVEAMRTLVGTVLENGNYIKGVWLDIFRCLSQLERIQGLSDREYTEITDMNRPRSFLMRSGSTSRIHYTDDTNSIAVSSDKIFQTSSRLNGEAIVYFIANLCEVSLEEISNSSQQQQHPRMYSLQKIVEICYYNMGRIRLEWSRIWAIIGDYFNKVGCHPSFHIANFSVDSLRQMAMKFLEKEELSHFQFQKDFLRPFGFILQRNLSIPIKDMVLQCIQQIIQARSKNVKSGWKSLLVVLTAASQEADEKIVHFAFETANSILLTNFENIVTYGSAGDFIDCLVSFASTRRFPRIGLRAVEAMEVAIPMMAQSSAAQKELIINSNEENAPQVAAKELDSDFKFWYPVLFGLYKIVMNCELEVRTRALDDLFKTLKQYGAGYSRDFWDVVFRGILFPIFDDLKHSNLVKDGGVVSHEVEEEPRVDFTEWISTTCIYALRSVLDLITFFFDQLSFLLNAVLDLFGRSLKQEPEILVRIGMSLLERLVIENAAKFTDDMWRRVWATFNQVFLDSTPTALIPGDWQQTSVGYDPKMEALLFAEQQQQQQQQQQQELGHRDLGQTMDSIPTLEIRDASPEAVVATAAVNEEEGAADEGAAESSSSADPRRHHRQPEVVKHASMQNASLADRKVFASLQAPTPYEFRLLVRQSMVQLLLIEVVDNVLNGEENVYARMSTDGVLEMLQPVRRAYRFAQTFNATMYVRRALVVAGLLPELPNLLQQELTSGACVLRTSFRLFTECGSSSSDSAIEELFVGIHLDVLQHCLLRNELKASVDMARLSPLLGEALRDLLRLDDARFGSLAAVFYVPVATLCRYPLAPDIRGMASDLLLRYRPLLLFPTDTTTTTSTTQ